MNIGILIPGFSSDENDPAIPVQLNLVRELAVQDDVRVLALRYPHRRDCYRVHGATVYSLGVGAWTRGGRRLALWADGLRTLRRLHHNRPFDVLHAMWADETGLIAAWAGRWLGVPVVVSILGGEFARIDAVEYGLQRGAFSRWTVNQAVGGADCVTVACNYVRRLMPRVFDTKVHTLVFGVDATLFRPGNTPAASRRLLAAGSLIGVKDHATLLRVLARLDDVTLDIAGDGPERSRLENFASQLGIADRVRFLGAVPHQAMPALYQQARLHVLPSLHEGLGMVTLEAAACGVPTVGTNVGLLPDYPELGVSVPVGDDAALARAVGDLLDDEERYAALRQSAYDLVTSRFTIRHTAADLRAVYTELQRR